MLEKLKVQGQKSDQWLPGAGSGKGGLNIGGMRLPSGMMEIFSTLPVKGIYSKVFIF